MATIQIFTLPEGVADHPHQPNAGYKFPKCSFGKKTVVNLWFQHTWFSKWPFLHYNEPNDVVYYHTCLLMFQEKKALSSTKADQAFVSEATSTGYNNDSVIVCYSIVSVSKLRQTVQVGLNA